MQPTAVRTLLFLLVSLGGLACDSFPSFAVTSKAEDPVRTRRSSQAIIAGKASSGDEQNAVVAIALAGGGGGGAGASPSYVCSGTLIAKNLVLLSRLCVADLNGTTFTERSASSLAVYTGANAGEKVAAGVSPAGVGRQIFVPQTSGLFPNVAVLMIDRDVPDPIATIRWTESAKVSEGVTVVGFGMDERNNLATTRKQRSGVSVLVIGPNAAEKLAVGEFVTGESFCWGDIGAPAFSAKTKAVIGVATDIGNGTPYDFSKPSTTCTGAGTRGLFNDVASAKEVLERAFKAAGATPKVETAKKPADPGSSEGDDDDDEEDEESGATDMGDEDGPGGEKVSRDDASDPFGDVASAGCSFAASASASASASATTSTESELLDANIVALLLVIAAGISRRARRTSESPCDRQRDLLQDRSRIHARSRGMS